MTKISKLPKRKKRSTIMELHSRTNSTALQAHIKAQTNEIMSSV